MPALEAILSASSAPSVGGTATLIWQVRSGTILTSLRGSSCGTPHALTILPRTGSAAGPMLFPAGVATAQKGRALVHVHDWSGSPHPTAKIVAPEPLATLTAHPAGHLLLATGRSGTAYLWEAASGTLLARWDAHYLPAVAAIFSPCGDYFATAGEDASVKVWLTAHAAAAASNGGAVQPLLVLSDAHARPVTDLVFGTVATPGTSPRLVSGSLDGTVRVWDLTTGECLATIAIPGPVTAVALDSTETRLWAAIESGIIYRTLLYAPTSSVSSSTTMTTTTTATGTTPGVLRGLADAAIAAAPAAVLTAHTVRVRTLSLSLDGTLLASGDDSGLIVVWDTVSGQVVRRSTEHAPHAVSRVAFVLVPPEITASNGGGGKLPSTVRVARTWQRVAVGDVADGDENDVMMADVGVTTELLPPIVCGEQRSTQYVRVPRPQRKVMSNTHNTSSRAAVATVAAAAQAALYRAGVRAALGAGRSVA